MSKLKIFIITITSMAGLGLLSILGFMYYVYTLSLELPSAEEISSFKYTEPMVVYDREGTVIAELGAERRYPVPLDKMPQHVGQAVVAVEDARFYEHAGIDLIGISRAFVANVKAGRVVEGGSTLTQQLVKVLYLTPERKLTRKLKEAILAYRIDNYLTKDEILELYLNQVNFGRGAYGVQAAAINYFGKNVDELTLAESALIAGIPKAPSYYSPHLTKNKERAISRRNHVLNRMHEVGYITYDQMIAAQNEEIIITDSVPLKLKYAGYFMDHVNKYLTEELGFTDDQKVGLKVYTTLNLDYQLIAEDSIKKNLLAVSKREGFVGPIGTYEAPSDLPTLIEGDDVDIIGIDNYSSLEDVPGYLESLGIFKARVVEINKDNATLLDMYENEGMIHVKDSEWAKPVVSQDDEVADEKKVDKLVDLTTALKVDDIVYVSRRDKQLPVPPPVVEEEIVEEVVEVVEGEEVEPEPEPEPITWYLEQDPEVEGAILSMSPKTGEIYTMVGGFSYEKSFFNRAIQAQRQTGSAFKPIVYSAAFESGFWPMDIIYDAPIIAEEIETDKVWKPTNYSDQFYGETTLKEAVLKSRNIVTVKLAEELGVKKITQYAREYGLKSDIPNDLSVSLGSASASVLEMANAYSVFANRGSRPVEPYFITKIEDIDGNVLHEFGESEQIQVLTPAASDIMTQILVDTVEKGGGWRAKAVKRQVGGKTGTTNGSKDGWFAGFTPNIVTVSWVGYDDFRSLGDYATGSSIAAPQWVTYMMRIVDRQPFELFRYSGNTAFFKVAKGSYKITDSVTGGYSFEIFPIDVDGNPVRVTESLIEERALEKQLLEEQNGINGISIEDLLKDNAPAEENLDAEPTNTTDTTQLNNEARQN